ncbi:MAG: DNA ligase [Alphaproteobacteria bacterium]|nr:DNA ligase [Alphaproteobacteria bacterium]
MSFDVTSPDRVIFEDIGLTKGALAAYFEHYADRLLAEIAGRPVSLFRCPKGLAAGGFFQRHPPKGKMGEGFVPVDGGRYTWFRIDDARGLFRAAQIGAIEIHPWCTAPGTLDRVDRLIVDLDPDEALDFAVVADTAHEVREWLAERGLDPWCRATGGKGLHVVASVEPTDWSGLAALSDALVAHLIARHPERFVTTVKKAERHGRILLDMGRSLPGATAVASWSPRARPGAPVAHPVPWDRVDGSLDPAGLTVPALLQRMPDDASEPSSSSHRA